MLKNDYYIRGIGQLDIVLFKSGISFVTSAGLGSIITPTYGKWKIAKDTINVNFRIKDTTATNCSGSCSEGEPYRNEDIKDPKKFISSETYFKNCDISCKKEGIKRFGKLKIEVLLDLKITKEKNKLIVKALRVKEINPIPKKENYFKDELIYKSGDTEIVDCD